MITQEADTIFEKCINRSDDGKSIQCKLGLWGLMSNNPESLEFASRHYWIQYYKDGEYDSILKESTKL